MEKDLKALEEIFLGMLDEVGVFQGASLILTLENPKVSATAAQNNPFSIHFVLSDRTQQVLSEYSSKITHDLEIRGMDSSSGNLEERQKRLQTRLIKEWTYIRLKPDVELNREHAAKALFLIMKTVPCILHTENRMGIKILTMLLIEGLLNALKEATRGEQCAAEEFIAAIKEIVNTKIFGDDNNETQWQMPISDNKKEIGQICMSNV
ncbi:hypothetical protein ACA910_005057 [Epithemia clementina (nom. ined.)]